MDIRNYFGKPKKRPPAAAAARPASSVTTASPPKKAGASAAPVPSSARKSKAAVAAAPANRGSDTEMEDNVEGVAAIAPAKETGVVAGSDSDTAMEGDAPLSVAKKPKAAAKGAAKATTSEEETRSPPRRTSPRRTSPRRKRKDPSPTSRPSPVAAEKKPRRRKIAADSSDDEEERIKRQPPNPKAVRKNRKSAKMPDVDSDGSDDISKTKPPAKTAHRNRKSAMTSDVDSDSSEGGLKRKPPAEVARKNRKLAKMSDTDSDSSEEVSKRKPATKDAGKNRISAKTSDTDSDSSEEVSKRKPATKDAGKNRISAKTSDIDSDSSEGGSKRKPAAKVVRKKISAGRGDDVRESKAKKGRAKKNIRAFVKDSESDEDLDEGDDDDDFKPKSEEEEEEEEDKDGVVFANDSSDDDFVEKKTRKRRATASPEKRAAPSPKRAASPKKKAVVKREPAAAVAAGPPKYHPPSRLLVSQVPFLSSSLTAPPPLPELPGNDPNINIDMLTPHCLDGLTFVFSGILSTDNAATAKTSAEIMGSSPNRGDYYANRRVDCSDSNCELSRDTATDVIKCLGGRVTSAVSGKTDYLIAGNILEDGRPVEEGSKYKKCVGLWETWRDKWRSEYDCDGTGSDKGKKKKVTGKPKKDRDPNSLVEVVRGIYEFYGLVVYLSEWKKSTLPESERLELEARQRPPQKGLATPSSVARPNPYAGSATSSANSSAAKTVTNPYAKKSTPTNPYAKKEVTNPYAKKSPPAINPYAKSHAKPYPLASTTPSSKQSHDIHQASGQQLGLNSLWADRYAPKTSREILGNSDSVNKLRKWLNGWESVFNNPQRPVRGLSGPSGPWKAALLSGPPGIGKTTTATLVARESGRDVLELNASDARSKKALGTALGDVTGSQVLSFDGSRGSTKKKAVQKRVIVMDEVDGMGAGDRSGISELIAMIKKSKVPIICICNDRSAQKMKSLTQYCMDLRYRRPTKGIIARRAVEIGRQEGMEVEVNAAEAMAESCGNDIRQVLNSLQMWSCKKKREGGGKVNNNMTYRDLKERQSDINKDEVLRVSMFDACRSIVEGSRGLSGADHKAINTSFFKRTDAYFVDYMMMGLMVHQNYLKVAMGHYNSAKLNGDEDDEIKALNSIHEATHAMSDFGMSEAKISGGDQNWALLPLCAILAVKVGHHAGGPSGGILPGYPEFAGWLGKNSTRNKKVRLLHELRRHVNYKVSADASELRMAYLPLMREQFQQLLFHRDGAMVTEAIALMDEYGLDRDDIFENFDEFLFNSKELKTKKFGELDSKSKAAFTRAYNSMAHNSQALVAEQGAEKTGRKKAGSGGGGEMGGAELDVVDDDQAAEEEEEIEEDLEALKKKFLKKGRGKSNGKKGKNK